jgi:hypothetical protein
MVGSQSLQLAQRPRIVFVVMSAVAPAATVDQLATALAPHTVLVHHDFSQQPDFGLASPNTVFVPHPVRTGWGVFGFVDGIFRSIEHALDELDFDYLQLLSPSCLPIKPLAAFEAVANGPLPAHYGAIDLLADPDCLMSVGWRAFTPMGTFRHRVARRLSRDYFGDRWERRDEAGVWLRGGEKSGLLPTLTRGAMRALSNPRIGRHRFDDALRPYYGSVWFGARTAVVRQLLEGFQRPEIREFFSRMHLSEEFLVPTLLKQAAPLHGPLNHFVHRFNEAHPGILLEEHLGTLRAQPAYFARKFPSDPCERVRLRVLQELCAPDRAQQPPTTRGQGGEAAPGESQSIGTPGQSGGSVHRRSQGAPLTASPTQRHASG